VSWRSVRWSSARIVSIAIGAGLNLGVYAVLQRVMLESVLTASAPERLVRIEPGISFPNYRDLRSADLPIDLAPMQMARLTWRTPDGAKALSGHVVSNNFFDVVGVRPIVGRTFTASDGDRTDLVVLSYRFWQQLGGDAAMVGRAIELNGWRYEITGVLPGDFRAVAIASGRVYVPIGARVTQALESRRAAQFDLFGRLQDRVTREQAVGALRAAAGPIEARFPDVNAGLARGFAGSSMDAFSFLRQIPPGRMVLGAAATLYALVGLALFVTCANVAGLLVSRADERRHEIAVRVALGATRARLTQQFLAESLVISMLGCAAGAAVWMIAVAWLQNGVLLSSPTEITAIPESLPLRYCLLLVCVVTVACGVAPAARANRLSVIAALQSRRTGRLLRRVSLQRALVAVQMAICFVLLTAAIFLLHNLLRLQIADPGFDITHTLTIDVQLPTSAPTRNALDLRRAIQAAPGVQAVSWGWPIGPPFAERIRPAGSRDGASVTADVRRVGPRFFHTMQIPLALGRDLNDEDVGASAPKPMVVNETFARRYLAAVDPIGRQFVRPRDIENGQAEQVLEIVGVARDTLARTVGDAHVPVVYVPQSSPSLTVRMAGPSASAIRMLRQTVERPEPPGTVVDVAPMADSVATALMPMRVATMLLGAVGAIGIVLAMTGLFAMVSHAASRRTFEIGVRIAIRHRADDRR
jgi:predicted permease